MTASSFNHRIPFYLFWSIGIGLVLLGIIGLISFISALPELEEMSDFPKDRFIFMNTLSLVHYFFFAYLCVMMAQQFKGFSGSTIFLPRVAKVVRRLWIVSAVYIGYNLLFYFLGYQLLGKETFADGAIYTQLIHLFFVFFIGAVFYFVERVLSQGIELQVEQDLTI
jgi:hypothetical protein